MKHPLFIFTAEQGKQVFAHMSEIRFREHLAANEGKVYEIHMRSRKRTVSQNKLYWKFLELIEKETGNNANDLHELFRRTLLSPTFIQVMGKEIKIPRSTTELSRTEFSDYIDKISAESGVPVPDTEDWKKWRDSAPLAGEEY